MEYEVLYYNDDGSAKVRMTLGDNILEQDFPVNGLDENVKQGMAIFQSEIDRLPAAPITDDKLIGKVVPVTTLPDIPPEDNIPEPPADTLVPEV